MKKNIITASSLTEHLAVIPKKNKPPLYLWNPPFCGDIDVRILRDGSWLYMGSRIERLAMIKLFSSVLVYGRRTCAYLFTATVCEGDFRKPKPDQNVKPCPICK